MAALEGQVALVTGSSRGIGAGIARLFARHSATVAIHGRDRAALETVREDIERAGGRACAVYGDVTSFDEIEAMRQEIETRVGPVDILVANAGGNFTSPGAPFEELPESAWRATVDGNLTATFLTIKSFLPGMKERGRGNILTISSTAGRRPHPRSPIPYAAAKAAIQLMTQDLAMQVGPFGIRVNCIAPETILTERNEDRIPPEVQQTLIETHAIRRLGTPDDVAEAALFLVTPASGWISGTILDIAGGPPA